MIPLRPALTTPACFALPKTTAFQEHCINKTLGSEHVCLELYHREEYSFSGIVGVSKGCSKLRD